MVVIIVILDRVRIHERGIHTMKAHSSRALWAVNEESRHCIVKVQSHRNKLAVNYVNPSIPNDQILWVMNLKNITLWNSIFLSRSPPRNFVWNISAHVMLFFENRSFHHDRPPINFVINISTSPPTARSAENVYICWNVSYHVNVLSFAGNGHFS